MTTRSNYRSWAPSYATAAVPASCTTAAALSVGYTCASNGAAPVTSCFPWGVPTALSSHYTFYSPATACPSGYNYEKSRTRTTAITVPRSAAVQDQWVDGETAVYCCPDGYSWSDVAGHCRLQYGGIYVNVNCTNSNEVSTATLSEIGSPVRAMAPALQLRFQASDGTFEAPKSTEAVTTRVGGTPASRTAVATTTATSQGPTGAATQSAAKTGGAEGRWKGPKIALGLLMPLVLTGVLAQ